MQSSLLRGGGTEQSLVVRGMEECPSATSGEVIPSIESSSGVVVRSTGTYEKLSGHPARPVLGWVARVECLPSHFTCQAAQSGYRESWLSTVLRKRR